jgi:hypothetical protein
MRYDMVQFTAGAVGEGYQEIDVYGAMTRLTDLDGNTVTAKNIGYTVIQAEAATPSWGTNDVIS